MPTLKEAGYDVVVDAPNGIGAPKGLDAAVAARLREAFKVAAASPEFVAACDKIDAPLMYLDGPDYEKYVAATHAQGKGADRAPQAQGTAGQGIGRMDAGRSHLACRTPRRHAEADPARTPPFPLTPKSIMPPPPRRPRRPPRR